MSDISKTQSATLAKRLRQYLRYYGGWRAIFASPFLWCAVILSLLSHRMWHEDWVGLARSLIPNLLGFSLGSYTILFSIITQKIKRSLKTVKNERGIPYLYEMNATFFHFVLVQVLCLLFTFMFDSTIVSDVLTRFGVGQDAQAGFFRYMEPLGGFFGTTLLCYSIGLTIAAAMVVYRLATIVEPEPRQAAIQPGSAAMPPSTLGSPPVPPTQGATERSQQTPTPNPQAPE